MALKIKFHEYLNEFRNTRRVLTETKDMLKFSNDYGLGYESEKDLPLAIYTYGFNKDSADNSGHLIHGKDGIFFVDIHNESFASILLSDMEYELADFYYGEEYYWEKKPNFTPEENKYLREVKDAVQKLSEAHDTLNMLWNNEAGKIDLNEYLNASYPFGASFDEFTLEVNEWQKKVEFNLNAVIDPE